MLLVFSNMEADLIIIIWGNLLPVSVFYLEAVLIGIDIPIRDGQLLPPFPVPLCLPHLIAVFVIQGKIVITALRHIYINLNAKIIPLKVHKWDGEVIKIHILFITKASFQAAGLILDQKIQIQKCAAFVLIGNLISGMLPAVSVIAAEGAGILPQLHVPAHLPVKKSLRLFSRHEVYRLISESRSICGTLFIYISYSHCQIILHYCQLVIKQPHTCHSRVASAPKMLSFCAIIYPTISPASPKTPCKIPLL